MLEHRASAIDTRMPVAFIGHGNPMNALDSVTERAKAVLRWRAAIFSTQAGIGFPRWR